MRTFSPGDRVVYIGVNWTGSTGTVTVPNRLSHSTLVRWDETVQLETQFDAENHIEIDRSGIDPKDQRYEYRIVQIIKDFE